LSTAALYDSENVALELHALLKHIDAARFRIDLQARLRPKLEAARTQLQRLIDALRLGRVSHNIG
jgi:hypothetical protein